MRMIQAADLFCGAGGITEGLKSAAESLGLKVDLVAVNHWEIAIATHKENHPEATHYCAGVQDVDPRSVVPSGKLDILVAGPQCTFFSRARGGRPMGDQQRISPWLVLDWLEKLDVRSVLIENVPDLMKWGPVDADTGRPIRRLEGKTFLAYLQALESFGYEVEHRVINCADFGDATTRERLFILGRKGKRVCWPTPTHSRLNDDDIGQGHLLPRHVQPWKTAREVIDWSIPGESIYTRKKPLAENTLRRIHAGLVKFSGLPFVIGQQSSAAPRSVDDPLPTVATAGAISLIQPFLVKFYKTCDAVSIDAPLPTITARGQHIGLCQPFITTVNHGTDTRSYSIDEPLRTITGVDAWALAQPFLVQYNGTADAQSVDAPFPTFTTRDRLGLAQPLLFKSGEGVFMLDILFRMLLPNEMAAAHSYRKTYTFHGNRGDVVRQIGNSVPIHTATALCRALLT